MAQPQVTYGCLAVVRGSGTGGGAPLNPPAEAMTAQAGRTGKFVFVPGTRRWTCGSVASFILHTRVGLKLSLLFRLKLWLAVQPEADLKIDLTPVTQTTSHGAFLIKRSPPNIFMS